METVTWIDWDETRRMMTLGGAPLYHRLAAQWASEGLVRTGAAVLTRGASVDRDVELGTTLWRAAVSRSGAHFSSLNGAIEAKMVGEDGAVESVDAVGLLFCEEDLLKLLPRTPTMAEREEARRADEGEATEVRQEGSNNRGRKPQQERWQAFYFAVIALAKDERLNASVFGSATELGEEIAEMMGDSAFSIDHAKPCVAQIYKKFVAGN